MSYIYTYYTYYASFSSPGEVSVSSVDEGLGSARQPVVYGYLEGGGEDDGGNDASRSVIFIPERKEEIYDFTFVFSSVFYTVHTTYFCSLECSALVANPFCSSLAILGTIDLVVSILYLVTAARS